MLDDNTLTYIDEEGNEILCEILFTFDSEEFSKSYVLFYPLGSEDDDEDEIDVFAASYEPTSDDGVGELTMIDSDEEWQLISDVLEQFEESFTEEDDED